MADHMIVACSFDQCPLFGVPYVIPMSMLSSADEPVYCGTCGRITEPSQGAVVNPEQANIEATLSVEEAFPLIADAPGQASTLLLGPSEH